MESFLTRICRIPSWRFLLLTGIFFLVMIVHPVLMIVSCGFEHGTRYAAGQLTYLVYHCCIVPPVFAHMCVVIYRWLPMGAFFSADLKTVTGAICLFLGVLFAGYTVYNDTYTGSLSLYMVNDPKAWKEDLGLRQAWWKVNDAQVKLSGIEREDPRFEGAEKGLADSIEEYVKQRAAFCKQLGIAAPPEAFVPPGLPTGQSHGLEVNYMRLVNGVYTFIVFTHIVMVIVALLFGAWKIQIYNADARRGTVNPWSPAGGSMAILLVGSASWIFMRYLSDWYEAYPLTLGSAPKTGITWQLITGIVVTIALMLIVVVANGIGSRPPGDVTPYERFVFRVWRVLQCMALIAAAASIFLPEKFAELLDCHEGGAGIVTGSVIIGFLFPLVVGWVRVAQYFNIENHELNDLSPRTRLVEVLREQQVYSMVGLWKLVEVDGYPFTPPQSAAINQLAMRKEWVPRPSRTLGEIG